MFPQKHRLGPRGLFLVALLSAFGLADQARATSDGGQQGRLIAVAGGKARFAVVVEEEVQAPCGEEPCRVFLLAMATKAPVRQRVLTIQPPSGATALTVDQLRQRYLRSLPAPLAKTLGRTWEPLARLVTLKPGAADGEFAVPAWGTLRATLKRVRTVPSMAAHLAPGSLVPCQGPATCSTCKAVTRTVSGERRKGWTCATRTGRLTVEGKRVPCRCAAPAVLYELSLALRPAKGVRARLTGRGTRVLAEPWAMAQNMMGGCQGAGCTALALRVSAYLTKRGEVVVVGAGAHTPKANGTYLPLAAAVRLSRR